MVYSHTTSHEPEKQANRYWDEESTPLFPFGYGLSSSRFRSSDLVLDRQVLAVGESLTAAVTVTNEGDRDAGEVVQLYLHQRHGSASRPVRELKGFQRVTLPAGTSRTVEFTIGPDERRYWNAAARDFVLDSSTPRLLDASTPRPSTCGWAASPPRRWLPPPPPPRRRHRPEVPVCIASGASGRLPTRRSPSPVPVHERRPG